MGKTLYIKTDNNPLPQGLTEKVETLDCCCINGFCSFIGDALVGDLRDSQGTPYYRLVNPVGRLLYDFKEYDLEAFEGILTEWFRILRDILQKGFQEGKTTAKLQLPPSYLDWLSIHDNEYYATVGRELQERGSVVVLDCDLFDTIIPNIINKIKTYYSAHKDNIEIIVFSNHLINHSSYVAKELFKEIDDNSFFPKFYSFSLWKMLLHKKELERKERELLRLRERIEHLDDCKAFRIDDFILGEPKPSTCEQTDDKLNYKGGEIVIANGICEKITAKKGTEAFQILASCILRTNTDICSVSFDAICYHLNHFGFKPKGACLTANMNDKKTAFLVSSNSLASVTIARGIGATIAMNPALLHIANITGQIVYKESLIKETNDFICELKFYSANGKPGEADKLVYRRTMPNTLDEISICIKHCE